MTEARVDMTAAEFWQGGFNAIRAIVEELVAPLHGAECARPEGGSQHTERVAKLAYEC